MANQNIEMKHLNGSGTYDTLYPKTLSENTIISDLTANKIGLLQGSTVDEALNTLQPNIVYGDKTIKRVKTYLKATNPIEVGPYCEDPANYVCEGSSEERSAANIGSLQDKDLYDFLLGKNVYDGSYNSIERGYCGNNEFLKGRYSYSFTPSKAYKLDHVTKTANLILDLSSYVKNSKNAANDRIISVDDEYIYFAQHTAWNDNGGFQPCYGIIYKFDHSGNTVASYTDNRFSSWSYDPEAGFGTDKEYGSCFAHMQTSMTNDTTKDYIVISRRSTAQSTSGGTMCYLTIISKKSLKVVKNQYNLGSSINGGVYVVPIYDKNIIVVITTDHSNSDSYGGFYVLSLTEEGVTEMFSYGRLGPGYTDGYITFNGTDYYCITAYSCINYSRNDNKLYCKLKLIDPKTDTYFYTVVTENDFNFDNINNTNGVVGDFLTISYLTTENLEIGKANYDPVEDVFHSNGASYSVYPEYVPPKYEYEYTLNPKFTEATYFRTNGYYYFVRTYDNKVYKLEDKLYYTIDRLEIL